MDGDAIEHKVSASDPAVGLRAVSAMRRLADRLERVQVANARRQGWTWEAIAELLGVSRQAAQQKHGRD